MTEDYAAELERVAHRYRSLQVMVTAVREAVVAAREAGAPWTAIAEVTGIPEDELAALFLDGGEVFGDD